MSERERRGALPVVGDAVELVLDGTERAWRTRVEEVTPAAVLVVAPAFEVVAAGGVPTGVGAVLTWAGRTALRRAEGTIVAGTGDVVQHWWIRIERSRRTQRRGAYRLPLSRPVRLTIAGSRVDGATADLSETGVLVVLQGSARTRIGQRLTIRLALAEERSLLVPVQVVRSGLAADGRPTLGLAFVDLDDRLRDQLRRFVLDAQFRARASGGVSLGAHE